ncbi:MAG: NifB/NifX family molybdenum-iron cluster-binding protein [Candidatus Hodarchaeota archaeon]
MKIGLPSNGTDFTNQFSSVFGRCLYFIIYNSNNHEVEKAYPNTAQNATGGAGIQAAQSMIDNYVEAVIAPQMGPNAWNVLHGAGIKIYTGINGTIQQNINAFLDGQLNEMTVARGFGQGRGRGLGGGRGRGHERGQGRRQENFKKMETNGGNEK